jgi:hypothetical protein
MLKKVLVDGVEYVEKSSAKSINTEGLVYSIVRTYSAGVFAGYVKDRVGKEGTVINARRLWYWSGASSLSQLALEGVKSPDECKFPAEVPEVLLTEIIEIIPCTGEAKKSIDSVKIWKQ